MTEQPQRIADDIGVMNHGDAIAYFNALILDLKKQFLGHSSAQPITMERLNEGSKHIGDLMACRSSGNVY